MSGIGIGGGFEMHNNRVEPGHLQSGLLYEEKKRQN